MVAMVRSNNLRPQGSFDQLVEADGDGRGEGAVPYKEGMARHQAQTVYRTLWEGPKAMLVTSDVGQHSNVCCHKY